MKQPPTPKLSRLPAGRHVLRILTGALALLLAVSSLPAFSDDAEDYYQKGMTKRRDEKEIAVKYFEKAANMGHAKAQYELGEYYLASANSETFDYTKQRAKATAFQWFKMAADQGLPEALYQVGMCYEYGKGVQKNINEAINWYKRASEKGYSSASWSIAKIYDKDEPQNNMGGFGGFGTGSGYESSTQIRGNKVEAFKWYKLAAEQGDYYAYEIVAEAYEKGTYGCPVDLTEAFKYYKKASIAEQRFLRTKNTLIVAKAYEEGTYGPVDLTEAFKYYKKAADIRAEPEALYAVGKFYLNGYGVKKDEAAAWQFIERAADKGFGNALYMLYLRYKEGNGVEKDSKKAEDYYLKAVNSDITDPDYAYACVNDCQFRAMHALTQHNEKESDKWVDAGWRQLKNAANAGSIEAAKKLVFVFKYGKGPRRRGDYSSESVPYLLNFNVSANEKNYQHWLAVAAENGDMESQFSMGQQCMKEKDEKGALKWFRMAAEQGHDQAKEYVELLED